MTKFVHYGRVLLVAVTVLGSTLQAASDELLSKLLAHLMKDDAADDIVRTAQRTSSRAGLRPRKLLRKLS